MDIRYKTVKLWLSTARSLKETGIVCCDEPLFRRFGFVAGEDFHYLTLSDMTASMPADIALRDQLLTPEGRKQLLEG